MTRRIATQATALGLAFVATFAVMSGIHQLAVPAAVTDTIARPGDAPAPVQVVVVTGKRMAQG